MAFKSYTDGARTNDAELKKVLGTQDSAADDDGAEDDSGPDQFGEASFGNDSGGPGAKYLGPAPGPMMDVKPKLASALTMMGPKPTGMSPASSPKSSDNSGDDSGDDSDSSIPMLTADQLQAARDEKRKLGLYGAIADNLSNRQSFGNFFLGRMNPHTDASAVFRQQQGLVDQGIQDTKTLQKQALEAPQMQYMADLQKSDSDASTAKREEAKMGINALVQAKLLDPDKAQGMVASLDKMNGFQAGKMMEGNPLLKQAADVMKSQAMISMAGRRLDQGDKRIGIQEDNQAAKAASEYDNNPIMKDMSSRKNQIAMDRHTLQSSLENGSPITKQVGAEIAKGVANALGGAKGSGMTEMAKQEFNSLEGDLAGAKQYITGDPQDAMPEQGKKYLMGLLDRLDQGYSKVLAAQANRLQVGKEYAHNPAAQRAIQQKVDSYTPAPSGGGMPGVKDVLAGEQNPKIAAWARTYGYSYDQAAKILQDRMKNQGGQ